MGSDVKCVDKRVNQVREEGASRETGALDAQAGASPRAGQQGQGVWVRNET